MIRYAITDRSRFQDGDTGLLRLAAHWAADGIDFVQLREKQMAAGALTLLARKMVTTLGPDTRLVVNGRADAAIAAGAAGVHLTGHPEELRPGQVRRIFALAGAPGPVISVSCHTVDAVEQARDGGADLVLFSPVFEKRVDGSRVAGGAGLEMLQRVCAIAAPAKILALGGVTATNMQQCIQAGAAGVAGIRLFG